MSIWWQGKATKCRYPLYYVASPRRPCCCYGPPTKQSPTLPSGPASVSQFLNTTRRRCIATHPNFMAETCSIFPISLTPHLTLHPSEPPKIWSSSKVLHTTWNVNQTVYIRRCPLFLIMPRNSLHSHSLSLQNELCVGRSKKAIQPTQYNLALHPTIHPVYPVDLPPLWDSSTLQDVFKKG